MGPKQAGLEEQIPRESEGDPLRNKRRKKMDMEEKIKVFVSFGS